MLEKLISPTVQEHPREHNSRCSCRRNNGQMFHQTFVSHLAISSRNLTVYALSVLAQGLIYTKRLPVLRRDRGAFVRCSEKGNTISLQGLKRRGSGWVINAHSVESTAPLLYESLHMESREHDDGRLHRHDRDEVGSLFDTAASDLGRGTLIRHLQPGRAVEEYERRCRDVLMCSHLDRPRPRSDIRVMDAAEGEVGTGVASSKALVNFQAKMSCRNVENVKECFHEA